MSFCYSGHILLRFRLINLSGELSNCRAVTNLVWPNYWIKERTASFSSLKLVLLNSNTFYKKRCGFRKRKSPDHFMSKQQDFFLGKAKFYPGRSAKSFWTQTRRRSLFSVPMPKVSVQLELNMLVV